MTMVSGIPSSIPPVPAKPTVDSSTKLLKSGTLVCFQDSATADYSSNISLLKMVNPFRHFLL